MPSLNFALFRQIICDLSPPPSSLVGAFAYGSAVFPQHGRPSGNGQIDLVFLVSDPVQWHFLNIQRHPEHYSALMRRAKDARGIPSYLQYILTSWPGPKVYYNPLVQWCDKMDGNTLLLKYGVVSVENAIRDLTTWSDIYIAGRLHKPVLWIPTCVEQSTRWTGAKSNYAPLDQAQQTNLLAAFSYVLLTFSRNKRAIPETDLFHALASISYTGDWRMIVGEDKNKVSRLVTGEERLAKFRLLYAPCFSHPSLRDFLSFEPVIGRKDKFVLQIIPSRDDPTLVAALVQNLPERLRTKVLRKELHPEGKWTGQIPFDTVQALAKQVVSGTVRGSSVKQTLLGLISAGPIRSFVYAIAKLRKMFASLGVVKWS